MSLRTESSSVSHTSMSFIPGLTHSSMYCHTSRCTSAHCLTSLYMFFSRRSSSRFSSDVSRQRLSSLYDWISSGYTPPKSLLTGTEGRSGPPRPLPAAPFFFFFFFFFFWKPPRRRTPPARRRRGRAGIEIAPASPSSATASFRSSSAAALSAASEGAIEREGGRKESGGGVDALRGAIEHARGCVEEEEDGRARNRRRRKSRVAGPGAAETRSGLGV